ncbi:unnamed protein product [Rotaria sp. Silwood1]|nr:unnamed protein product [Rotaria sp. Silwood1]CAF4829640.1 unnamed protein product [Rotaria sp. Silwood1]
MTSTEQQAISSDRARSLSSVNVDLLECPICHDLLWNSVACQTCETAFCSVCICQWLANNPEKCPNRCPGSGIVSINRPSDMAVTLYLNIISLTACNVKFVLHNVRLQ